MKTLIEVTQHHIRKGEHASCDFCPVALAVKEKTDFFFAAAQDEITLTKPSTVKIGWHKIPTPKEASEFIFMYDSHKPVTPFSFYLDIPDEYLKPNN